MPGLFESLGGLVERARGFFGGIFGQAAREDVSFGTISEAMQAGGLELDIPELSKDFDLQQRQAELSERILSQPADKLIPGDMHLETDRLLPHKYAYEVEMTQILEDGTTKTHPFYVGSDTRLTPQEILDIADEEGEESPEPGTIAYIVGGITASWVCTEY